MAEPPMVFLVNPNQRRQLASPNFSGNWAPDHPSSRRSSPGSGGGSNSNRIQRPATAPAAATVTYVSKRTPPQSQQQQHWPSLSRQIPPLQQQQQHWPSLSHPISQQQQQQQQHYPAQTPNFASQQWNTNTGSSKKKTAAGTAKKYYDEDDEEEEGGGATTMDEEDDDEEFFEKGLDIPRNLELTQLDLVTQRDWSGLEIPDDSYLDPSRLPQNRENDAQPHPQQQKLKSVQTVTSPLSNPLALYRAAGSVIISDKEAEEFGVEIQPEKMTVPKAAPEPDMSILFPPSSKQTKDSVSGSATSTTTATASTTKGSGVPAGRRTVPRGDLQYWVSTEVYGDGSELDDIDDLEIDMEEDLKNVGNRNASKTNLVEVESPTTSARRKQMAGIQNYKFANVNQGLHRSHWGNMAFNPELQRWDGNWDELKDFERVTLEEMAQPKKRQPAAIHYRGIPLPQVSGNMIFDSLSGKWVGNEEDSSIFDHIDSDTETDTSIDSDGGHRRKHASRRKRSELVLTSSELKRLHESEIQHQRFMQNWNSPQSRTGSLSGNNDHFKLIRAISMKLQ